MHVYGVEVNPQPEGDLRELVGNVRAAGASEGACYLDRRGGVAELSLLAIVIAVQVPEQVEAGAGPGLNQGQGLTSHPSGNDAKGGHEAGAAAHHVSLDHAPGDKLFDRLPVIEAEGAEARIGVIFPAGEAGDAGVKGGKGVFNPPQQQQMHGPEEQVGHRLSPSGILGNGENPIVLGYSLGKMFIQGRVVVALVQREPEESLRQPPIICHVTGGVGHGHPFVSCYGRI